MGRPRHILLCISSFAPSIAHRKRDPLARRGRLSLRLRALGPRILWRDLTCPSLTAYKPLRIDRVLAAAGLRSVLHAAPALLHRSVPGAPALRPPLPSIAGCDRSTRKAWRKSFLL